MAYQSFFSGASPKAAPSSGGGGYQSFFGGATIAQPSPQQLQQQRQQTAKPAPAKSAPSPKGKSFLNKFTSGAKSFASGATAGEQKFAQGIARVLPGGSNDIQAEAKSAQADQSAGKTYADLYKAGKISKAQYQKATGQVAQEANKTSKQVTTTEKSMPTKAQIGLGAASTAADIITAGTLSRGKAALTPSKSLLPLIGGVTKKATAARIAAQLAENATAGGLNAAAAGGTKGDVIKNAAAGAALPEILHHGAELGGKGISKVADAISTKPAKELINKTKATNILEKLAAKQDAKQAKVAVADLPTLREPTPQELPHPAEAVVQQHMNEHYAPSSQHPDEKFAADYLKNNTSKALHDYEAKTKEIYGSKNFVGGDDAKQIIPGMESSKSSVYHEPASQLAKGYYKHLLSNETTRDNPVLITAGGTGAGKTSALKKDFNENGVNPNDYAAIVDTNLTSPKSAVDRIEPALETGRDVQVQFVYRDPLEAFEKGVIPRSRTEGRAITAFQHAETHAGALDTIKQLADKYKDNDNVAIRIIDNSRGKDKSIPVTLDFLHDKVYTKSEIENKIHTLLDEQLQKGAITHDEHAIFKGQEASQPEHAVREKGSDVSTVERPTVTKTVREPKPASQKPVTATKAEPKTLTPSQTAHMEPIGGYTHSKDMLHDYADMLREQEKGASGGQLIPTREGVYDSYKRESTHSKFYREFYKENKKAPTIADYREEAHRQLTAGTDAFGAGEDYKKLLEREGQPLPIVKVNAAPVESNGITKTSKLGEGIKAGAVREKLAKNFGDLPQYSEVNLREQAQLATDLIQNDEARAIKIALGKEAAPAHLLPESVLTAVELKAQATGDAQLLRDLAHSSLVGEATAMGQRIRALGERNANSTVGNIRQIIDKRKAAFEQRTGKTVGKAVSAEVKAIREAKPKIMKSDWSSFLEGIKC